jgi:hypothetical protein
MPNLNAEPRIPRTGGRGAAGVRLFAEEMLERQLGFLKVV